MKRSILLVTAFLLFAGLACNLGAAQPKDETRVQPETNQAEEKAASTPAEPTQAGSGPASPTQEEPEAVEPTQASEPGGANSDVAAPGEPVKLVFIHHSSGENWLNDEHGKLGLALMENNYFVSDTNYGWGPDGIGDRTDIGQLWDWFAGPESGRYMEAVINESGQNSAYTRLENDPGGENTIVMFKSCFPNSALSGNPGDVPTVGDNPLRGQDASSEFHTVANVKGIYNDLLAYFATRPDKLFVVITAPPLGDFETNPEQAANARAFNRWLVEEWRQGYPLQNVAVFDFYNVLTSNGGSPDTNDAGAESGNHHRYWNETLQYITDQGGNVSAYAADGDSHPNPAGNQKASAEFLPLLNEVYAVWSANQH